MPRVILPHLHEDQLRAHQVTEDARGGVWAANAGKGRVALRCGRRWGKTKYGGARISNSAAQGQSVGWFRPGLQAA